MRPGQRLRVLLLAEQCNPEWPSLPIVGYKYALALAERCDVVVATQVRNEPYIRPRHPAATASLEFDFIDTEYVAAPLHRAAAVIRGNPEVGWSTSMAMTYLPYVEFERQAWKRFRGALDAGRFDLVHRITPMSPTMPSYMAGRASQPFLIGPLNGNLDWPAAFTAEQKREKEGLRRIRNVSKYLPFARRTWRDSDRVLAAFQHTIDDLTAVDPSRIVSFPEVGFDETIFHPPAALRPGSTDAAGSTGGSSDHEPLTFVFVGRLVPYKLAEVAIRAFAGSSLAAQGHRLRIVGDGPERERLEQMVTESEVSDAITFEGRRDQSGVAEIMRSADVFVFPSIRELGAGVVVEAMACGLFCIVTDYGGPADLVGPERGRKVPMAPLDDLVESFRREMEACATAGREQMASTRQAAVRYAFDNFPWQRKAELTEDLYREVLAERG